MSANSQKEPPALTTLNAQEAFSARATEQSATHTFTSQTLAFGGALRITWTTFERDGQQLIEGVRVVSTTPVRADVWVDIGSGLFEKKKQYVTLATTWTNRRGALAHDYFRVWGDGTSETLGTYVD